MRGLMEWAVIFLGVIALSLVVIVWQFVGDDIGQAWEGFWESQFGRRLLGYALRSFLWAAIIGVAGGIWTALSRKSR